jgi:hypothetical protein
MGRRQFLIGSMAASLLGVGFKKKSGQFSPGTAAASEQAAADIVPDETIQADGDLFPLL